MQSNTIDPEQTAASRAEEGGYFVSELFYSVQGEGVLAGTPMVFLRLGGCNLRCRRESVGFDCDTDFQTGENYGLDELVEQVQSRWPHAPYVLLTGGEPGLQVDASLVGALNRAGYWVAIETNGTVKLPGSIDHVCLSPKSAWHTLRQREATELKLVRAPGQPLPDPDDIPVEADHLLVSPRFEPDGSLRQETVDHCLQLVLDNPEWRLSLQTHKFLGAR